MTISIYLQIPIHIIQSIQCRFVLNGSFDHSKTRKYSVFMREADKCSEDLNSNFKLIFGVETVILINFIEIESTYDENGKRFLRL